MDLIIKSLTEYYEYLISPDVAKYIRMYLDEVSDANGLVVKVRNKNLLGEEE